MNNVSYSFAAVTFNGGVYTNLCGTGFDATGNRCNSGCNVYSGSCSASDAFVVKWTCDGKITDCRSNETSFTRTQSVVGTSCGKTVQIDVFDKDCRSDGGWSCEPRNLLDYLVWYSGDCSSQSLPTKLPTQHITSTPTATYTPTPTQIMQISCDELLLVSGNNSSVPATVKMKVKISPNSATLNKYRFYFGDGNIEESDTNEIEHRYEVSGTFSVKVEIKDKNGNWKSSSNCEKTVSIKSSTLESHKSECSNLYIVEGNNMQAPVTVKTVITGYDNKGVIQGYKVDFDNAVSEQLGNTFEHKFETAGTYTLRSYIKDSQGHWVGGENACKQTLYIQTKPLITQPATGASTLFSITALVSGATSLFWLMTKKLRY